MACRLGFAPTRASEQRVPHPGFVACFAHVFRTSAASVQTLQSRFTLSHTAGTMSLAPRLSDFLVVGRPTTFGDIQILSHFWPTAPWSMNGHCRFIVSLPGSCFITAHTNYLGSNFWRSLRRARLHLRSYLRRTMLAFHDYSHQSHI